MSLTNLQKAGYKPKDRSCRKCNETFFAIGPSAVNCPTCAAEVHLDKSKITNDNYRRRKGVNVGIGSGNGAGSGPEHHSYKTGVGLYSVKYLATVEHICERCKTDIDFSNSYKWCVHHKDRNRENNNLSNLELLCKRCHII